MKKDGKIVINEETLYKLVKESFKQIILKEAPGSYFGEISDDEKHAVNMVRMELSNAGYGDAISSEYTNGRRIVVELEPFSYNLSKVNKILGNFGYKYKSSQRRSNGKEVIVYERD